MPTLPPTLLQHPGEIAALSAAFLWTFASYLFNRAGKSFSPIELNLAKGMIAIFLFIAAILIQGKPLFDIPTNAILPLAVSGIVGIGLGDTAFFASLQRLGTRRALLIGTLAPPSTALIAFTLLGEKLPPAAWLGILIAAAGVAWVITEQNQGNNEGGPIPWQGIGFGLLATLAQGSGVVLSRAALTQSSIGPEQSAIIRLLAGALILAVWMLIRPKTRAAQPVQKTRLDWGWVLAATFLGTFICIWLQQFALQHSPAGIAQTLLSTSPLFALPIAWLNREKLSLRSVFGVLIALAGVALLFQ